MICHPFCLFKITKTLKIVWQNVERKLHCTCVPVVQPKLIKCTKTQPIIPFSGSFPVENAHSVTFSLAINSKYLWIANFFINWCRCIILISKYLRCLTLGDIEPMLCNIQFLTHLDQSKHYLFSSRVENSTQHRYIWYRRWQKQFPNLSIEISAKQSKFEMSLTESRPESV